jgi:hypothetical protein
MKLLSVIRSLLKRYHSDHRVPRANTRLFRPQFDLFSAVLYLSFKQTLSFLQFVTSIAPGKAAFNLAVYQLLGAFAILRKENVSCVISVCLSVCTEQLGSHWMDFHEI